MEPTPESPVAGRGVHRFARLTAAATFLLVIAGGLVTSTGSGLAVPDWPLSYGMLFPPMVGGIFYEHGHRMIAGVVGLLTGGLAIWLGLREPRRWVRRLGYLAVATVVAQAILGGITVLWLLPPAVSVGHAGLAMAFFTLISVLALVTSPGWKEEVDPVRARGRVPLPLLATVAAGLTYLQILLGAAVRHVGAGLACPDFPLCNGELWPTLSSTALTLQMGHRATALAVALLVGWTAWTAWRHHEATALRRPAAMAAILVVVQVTLGALSVWSRLAVAPTTAHVGGGALLLVSLVVLALRARRRIEPVATPATARPRRAPA